jgi:hypothetical protein
LGRDGSRFLTGDSRLRNPSREAATGGHALAEHAKTGDAHGTQQLEQYGVKHSDQRLAKLRVAKLIRRSGPKG